MKSLNLWYLGAIGLISAALVLILLNTRPVLSAGGNGAPATASATIPEKTVILQIEGMTCPACGIPVKSALANTTGVSAVDLDFPARSATVTFDPDALSTDRLTAAVGDSGYSATLESIHGDTR